MDRITGWLHQPWPWYVAGPLIGLTVPALLLLGNKAFGISSSLRHLCAACVPAGIPFFRYDWKAQLWNLFFVVGIVLGGAIASTWLTKPHPVDINPGTTQHLQGLGIHDFSGLMPLDLFSAGRIFSPIGLVFMVLGGLLVGFGTRWAGGCTSGHTISGLSNLQWPSLVASICFFAGGFFSAWVVVPWLLDTLL